MKLTATKIPADLAGSGWYDILPAPGEARELKGDIAADWVVVGAGFAGLSAARRISKKQPNDKVVVVDAQRIAWGASGRNSGFFIDLPHHLQSDAYVGDDSDDLRQIRKNRFAIDFARDMIDEFGLHEFASNAGRINAATSPSGFKAVETYASHLEKLGEGFTRYDPQILKEITGSDYYIGGIHTPGCLLVQPAGYIRGIANNLPDNVRIFENSPALKLNTGEECCVETPKGRVTAKRIVLTVNGHLESFGLCKNRLMHIFLYGSMTRQLTAAESTILGGHNEWGITPAHPMGSTLRRLKEGRILVRNHITYNPKRQTSRALINKSKHRHSRSFKSRFPNLKAVTMEYCWGGHVCLSRNTVPVFGEVEKGLFVACVQNGIGATYGTLAGISIVDHALGDNHGIVMDHINADQPEKLFPEPLMSVGANTHLWWGQKQAGKEL